MAPVDNVGKSGNNPLDFHSFVQIKKPQTHRLNSSYPQFQHALLLLLLKLLIMEVPIANYH